MPRDTFSHSCSVLGFSMRVALRPTTVPDPFRLQPAAANRVEILTKYRESDSEGFPTVAAGDIGERTRPVP
jgi:hypothetical protein